MYFFLHVIGLPISILFKRDTCTIAVCCGRSSFFLFRRPYTSQSFTVYNTQKKFEISIQNFFVERATGKTVLTSFFLVTTRSNEMSICRTWHLTTILQIIPILYFPIQLQRYGFSLQSILEDLCSLISRIQTTLNKNKQTNTFNDLNNVNECILQ